MVHQPGKPSTKALGKRRMPNSAGMTPNALSTLTPSAGSPMADEEMDEGSFSQSAGGAQARLNNKRVLPLRRRGGIATTVGTHEVDVNLLDMIRRKGENDPLIPTRTVFILTTDSSVVPSASTSEIGLNSVANERYFERPEVIKAYKAQRDIQVPDFIPLDEVVGGRLRARSDEEDPPEISDEAYEKRHRKHEMVEKRQRLWEKEKLQHEHFKLKGRIEQLKNMDPNAFLVLPSDAFGEYEDTTTNEVVDGAEPSIGSLHEAERRRRLMLDVATSLEQRYRTLLPTDRKAEARHVVYRASASTEPSIPDEEVASNAFARYQDVSNSDTKTRRSKFKFMPRPSPQPTPVKPTESSRRRKGTPLCTATPSPEYFPHEDITTVISSRSATSRLRKKMGKKSSIARKPTVLQLHPTSFANHTSHTLICDHDQSISNDLPNHGTTSAMDYEDVVFDSSAKDALSQRSGLHVSAHAVSDVDIAQSRITGRKSSRKKKQASRASGPPGIPDHEVNHVSEVSDEYAPDNDLNVSEDAQIEVDIEHDITASPSQLDRLSMERVDEEMDAIESPDLPAEEDLEEMAHFDEDDRSMLFAQLQRLERPDQYGEPDIIEQPEVNETPTSDEPITPPVEHETLVNADSIITEPHDTFLTPTSLEHMNKRRKRHSTPYLHRRPSISSNPELTEPATLSVTSMQSYEIQESSGKGRRPKPLGSLLALSKHNAEPGRKTGRSVKAFGVEVPPWDTGKDIDFELPTWIIREVAGRRVDNMSDAESVGDPPSFSAGMDHGEVGHDGIMESISAAS